MSVPSLVISPVMSWPWNSSRCEVSHEGEERRRWRHLVRVNVLLVQLAHLEVELLQELDHLIFVLHVKNSYIPLLMESDEYTRHRSDNRVMEGARVKCGLVEEGGICVPQLDGVLHVLLVDVLQPVLGVVLGPSPGRHHMRGGDQVVLVGELAQVSARGGNSQGDESTSELFDRTTKAEARLRISRSFIPNSRGQVKG